MFGRQNHSGGGQYLVEFRAGRMNMIGKMVHPDTRKGLVYLHQTDDGLMHFCWKDRNTGIVEDDLIVFPDEYEYKRVDQCKTGRVYVLKFKTSSRRMFYWMQEPKTDRDEEYCRRINDLMNKPPTVPSITNAENVDLQFMLNNMSQQQLMQLFGNVGQLGGIGSLLGSMNQADAAEHAEGQGGSETVSNSKNHSGGNMSVAEKNVLTGSERPLNTDLSVGTEAVIISDPKRANMLSIRLPEMADAGESKRQRIKETIAMPEFQDALSRFSEALKAAKPGPNVTQFELTPEAIAAAETANLEAFVKALEKALPEGAIMGAVKATNVENIDEKPTGSGDANKKNNNSGKNGGATD